MHLGVEALTTGHRALPPGAAWIDIHKSFLSFTAECFMQQNYGQSSLEQALVNVMLFGPLFVTREMAGDKFPRRGTWERNRTMPDLDLEKLNEEFESKSATDVLRWTYDNFDHDRIKLSTSFGAEGIALIDILVNMGINPNIFTVDTGRLFQETYDVWAEVVEKYDVKIVSHSPDPEELRKLYEGGSPNLFYDSVENRKRCCYVRKVLPLKSALKDTDVWLSSLRRTQGDSRRDLPIISPSSQYDLYKIYPMANWLEQNVWTYIRANSVPYDKLYDQGFKTIGCAPCTRPVRMGESVRSGRWWWEETEEKECGIHIEDGVIMRTKPAKNYQI
jgi:phosphoadenosine phosphosulfate reductase